MKLDDVVINTNSDDEKELSDFLGPTIRETPVEKYARLQQLERDLHERQTALDEEANALTRFPNWPRYFPVVYADLVNEIPDAARGCVRMSMYGVLFTLLGALVNLISVCAAHGLSNHSIFTSVIFALVQGFGVVYFSRELSYARLYNGCRNRDVPNSWNGTQLVLILWLVYLFLGFPDSGSAGLATFINLVSKTKNTLGKISAFITTALYICSIVFSIRTMKLARTYQQVSGMETLES